jgi:hypothetical protein
MNTGDVSVEFTATKHKGGGAQAYSDNPSPPRGHNSQKCMPAATKAMSLDHTFN